MIMKPTKKRNMNHKISFRFHNCIVEYNIPNQVDIFYLTDDHEYNKGINDMFLGLEYKRHRLFKSDWLIELKKWFEYKRHGIYLRDDELWMAENERWYNIRNAPLFTD